MRNYQKKKASPSVLAISSFDVAFVPRFVFKWVKLVDFDLPDIFRIMSQKKVRESQGSATITNRSPSQTPRGRGNRQIQTSTNRTNVRKALRLALSFPKRGNRNTKRTKKHNNKMTHGKTYNKSPRRINHNATKSKTNTGTTALERSVE